MEGAIVLLSALALGVLQALFWVLLIVMIYRGIKRWFQTTGKKWGAIFKAIVLSAGDEHDGHRIEGAPPLGGNPVLTQGTSLDMPAVEEELLLLGEDEELV